MPGGTWVGIGIGVGGHWWQWELVDNVGGGRVWGPSPPIDAVRGQNVHGFRNFFFGSGAGSVANVEVLPVPMLLVANAWQRRRDGEGFYHGPGEMTRKMCGNRGHCDILAGAWRGADPTTRR